MPKLKLAVGDVWYQDLVSDLRKLAFEGIVKTKWTIGRRILNDFEKFGKPEYGAKTVDKLAVDLKGSRADLYRCIQFAEQYPELSPAGDNWSWREVRKMLPAPKKPKAERVAAPEGIFDVIVIDPPWAYGREYDPKGSRVASPYPEMSQDELLALRPPAAENAVMFLWTTHQFMLDAHALLNEWGFDYKATVVWDKEKMGMGSWFRMQCEFCLLGIKGYPAWNNTTWRDIIREPRREHSRKPERFYEMVEAVTEGERLDYYARQQRKGWTSFGDETTKFSEGS